MTAGRWFLLVTAILGGMLLALLLVCSRQVDQAEKRVMKSRIEIVKVLRLTDFALWSEARYTRHPSQSDWFTPFQDFPSSYEHFPAGSLLGPLPARPTTRLEFRSKSPGS